MDALNSNEKTMEYFPHVLTREDSKKTLERFSQHFDEHGFTYFLVREKTSGSFIGFIGCKWQDYEHPACPHVDIGWRLLPEFWGKGYATEGAKACLDFIFKNYDFKTIFSCATEQNLASFAVMKKLGMSKTEEFDHPRLTDYPEIIRCHMYTISR